MAVISTETVQLELTAMVAPVGSPKVRVVSPVPGVQVGDPKQVVLALGVLATSKPVGKSSVNFTPLSATAAASLLLSVKVSFEVPPTTRVEISAYGEIDSKNALLIVGGGSTSVHPVNVMLSRNKFAPELSFNAPEPEIRKVVFPPVLVSPVKSIV